MMSAWFQTILTTSFHGSIVILAVLLLRLVLCKAPKKYICLLWVLSGIRLLLPIPMESPFSIQPPELNLALPQGLAQVLSWVWLAVAVLIGLYSVSAYLRLRRRVMDAVQVPGGWETDRIETAFVLGFIKPKIYIPTGMSDKTKQQILSHERTHLEKGDHWIKMLGFLALALHWFNPLVWLSYILLCKDIEMACDERVVRFMDMQERKDYSRALLDCSTNHVHYAACPVAFGEVNVKFRIQSILNYRKPSFWLSLLAVLAFVFVGVCLMTNPQCPPDPEAAMAAKSSQTPEDVVFPDFPPMEENPDWGLTVELSAEKTTGATVCLAAQERFASANEDGIEVLNTYIERWDGESWQPMERLAQQESMDRYGLGFAVERGEDVSYAIRELDWTLSYGALPAGDYCLCQTIQASQGEAVLRTGLRIYREQLPAEQEQALSRCEAALDAVVNGPQFAVVHSQTAPDGQVQSVAKYYNFNNNNVRVDHYMGQFLLSSNVVTKGDIRHQNMMVPNSQPQYIWEEPFHVLRENRRILFPEGIGSISKEMVSYCSVWKDAAGNVCQGQDTFRFREDGSLASIERRTENRDAAGQKGAEQVQMLEVTEDFIGIVGQPVEVQDSFTAANNSPWGVYFRVDDDLLSPTGGEVSMGVDAIGVSNYTADGTYWLEKKEDRGWQRLGGPEFQASWGEDVCRLKSRASVYQVDWSGDYGTLEPGIYRMGKHFYHENESIIQYAEFAIYAMGGVYGDGAQEALDRVDAALDSLQAGNYRVEKWEPVNGFNIRGEERVKEVIWKYGETMVEDICGSKDTHSLVIEKGDWSYGDWLRRDIWDSAYDSVYFPQGWSHISDREIQLVYTMGGYTLDNCELYTYSFDESGRISQILCRQLGGSWDGWYTRYVVTDTPEEEIQRKVQTCLQTA